VNFKPYFAALAARMAADLKSVQLVERRNLPAGSFPPEKQPVLIVLESTVAEVGPPPLLWDLGAILILHARIGGADMAPGEQHLDLISNVGDALRWRAGEPHGDQGNPWTTLGGLVRWARLEGDVTIEDDVVDAAQVSITMRATMRVLDDL